MYIHIPFCKSKCHYCDFLSVSDISYCNDYFKSLQQELKSKSHLLSDKTIKTIYIGGGTPSFVPEQNIIAIMKTIRSHYKISDNAEITIEANPDSITQSKLLAYKSEGINRISIGFQASQDKLLKKLGRAHDRKTFFEIINLVKQTGFKNINIDLMFGLPEQSYSEWLETIEEIIKIKPKHVSAYSLILEEDTDFYQKYSSLQPDESLECKMYDAAKKIFTENGYKHYEISNFSLPSFESKHNTSYWKCDEYMGFGLGAHSHFNGERFHNATDFKEYCSLEYKKYDVQKLTLNDKISEFMFLGLRMRDGISENQFEQKFGKPIDYFFKQAIKNFENQCLIIRQNGNIKLTDRGIEVSNIIFAEFLLPSNYL